MITRLEATRYRCFEKLDVDLGAFQIIVGPNGSGKTTLLDIPCLMGDLLRSQSVGSAFIERINSRSPRSTTFEELIFAGQGDSFLLAIEAKLPEQVTRQHEDNAISTRGKQAKDSSAAARTLPKDLPTHARYELRFQIFEARGLEVQNEYVFLFPERHAPPRGEVRLHGEQSPHRSWKVIVSREYGGEAAFLPECKKRVKAQSSQIDADQLSLPKVQFESREDFPAARWLYELLTRGTVFFDPDWNTLQQASPPGLPRRILPSGRNLPWLALELKRGDKTRFRDWVTHVREALRNIKNIDVKEREDDHHAYFVVTYEGGFTVTSSGLSDGTLRVLAFTLPAYLQEQYQPASIVTEEPENGIHPRAIEAVLQSLSSLYGKQVWVSSHSPVVLAHSKLANVLCAQLRKDGSVSIVRGPDHPRLKEWSDRVDIPGLFAAGVLG